MHQENVIDSAQSSCRQDRSGISATCLPRSWLTVPLALLVMLSAMELTNIDRIVSHWFYDESMAAFPLRYTFLLETVMHYWTKYAVILTAFLVAAAAGLTYLLPPLRSRRRILLFIVLAMTLAPLTVTALKEVTNRPCPWELAEFGGAIPYTHLFGAHIEAHAPGRCFPAGHASTGFALMAFFFAAHHERRRMQARLALIAGIGAGLVLGIGRVVQGAHFISHVLWSGLVCWLVMTALYALLMHHRNTPGIDDPASPEG